MQAHVRKGIMKKLALIVVSVFWVHLSSAQVNERFRSKKGKETEQQETTQPQTRTQSRTPVKSNTSSDIWDDLVFGGNFSLSFGTNNTFVYLAPSVGYRINEQWVAGTGFIYQYAKLNRVFNRLTGNFETVDFETSIYGPKFFVNYFPAEFLFLGTQLEYLNHDFGLINPNTGAVTVDNIWTSVLFLEVGIAQEVGSKGYMQLGVRYNVLHDFDSPYGTALFPFVGFFF